LRPPPDINPTGKVTARRSKSGRRRGDEKKKSQENASAEGDSANNGMAMLCNVVNPCAATTHVGSSRT
jgi:hypothetical protein